MSLPKLNFRLLILSVCIPFTPLIAKDTVDQVKNYKNIVRANLTNPMIFGGKSYILGYERLTWKSQSFSINFGITGLSSKSVYSSSGELSRTSENSGYHLSADYRFYLKKENKYPAPRGIYIGPYYSFNNFRRLNTWELNSSSFQGEVSTDVKLNIHSVGCELGYQFILWKRLALDFVLLGPGFARYSLSANINTTLNADDQEELIRKINDELASRFPGYSVIIDQNEFKKTGKVDTNALSFRYIIHLGFRF